MLDSPNSDQSVAQYMSSQGIAQLYNNLLSDKARKRKHENGIPENPWMKQQQQFAQQRHHQLQQGGDKRVDANSMNKKNKKQKYDAQTAMKKKGDAEYAEQLLQQFNDEERKALGVTAHGEKLSPGVYLRSTKISTFKPALQNKVVTVLQEIDMPTRPAMPSYEVILRYEKLLKRIVTLIDLKKHLDKLDAEKAITK